MRFYGNDPYLDIEYHGTTSFIKNHHFGADFITNWCLPLVNKHVDVLFGKISAASFWSNMWHVLEKTFGNMRINHEMCLKRGIGYSTHKMPTITPFLQTYSCGYHRALEYHPPPTLSIKIFSQIAEYLHFGLVQNDQTGSFRPTKMHELRFSGPESSR